MQCRAGALFSILSSVTHILEGKMWGWKGDFRACLGYTWNVHVWELVPFVPLVFGTSIILGQFAKPIKPKNSPRLAGICSLFSKLLCHSSSSGLEIPLLPFSGDISRRERSPIVPQVSREPQIR